MLPAEKDHLPPSGRKFIIYKELLTKDADSKCCRPQDREPDKYNHPNIFFFHDMRLL